MVMMYDLACKDVSEVTACLINKNRCTSLLLGRFSSSLLFAYRRRCSCSLFFLSLLLLLLLVLDQC